MNAFIAEPKTLDEHVSNVRFQLENVEGYIQMANDRKGDLALARIKAECLCRAASELLAQLSTRESQ